MQGRFGGLYCAAITPFKHDEVDVDALIMHLHTLKAEGCHGALLMGTTGEGPSLSVEERKRIIDASVSANTGLVLMAGTGTPNLPETIVLTRYAYDHGIDAALVVPPYYFRSASVEGLYRFYAALFDKAVPSDRALLAYHIPQVSGVAIPPQLLERLIDQYGLRMAGVKDSGGDMSYAAGLIDAFPTLDVFVGSEKLLYAGMQCGAVGCITAGANVLAPQAVAIWNAWQHGGDPSTLQTELSAARSILDRYAPAAASLKQLLNMRYGGESWEVRPPLVEHDQTVMRELTGAMKALQPDPLPWLKR
jgi:4-hydroxy-tetrahydrodipicolinate synthase